MERFILNVVHRPEMVPEYAEKVTGHGKEEDISRKGCLGRALNFIIKEAVELALEHHRRYAMLKRFEGFGKEEGILL